MNSYKTFWFSLQEITNLWAALQEHKDIVHASDALQGIYDEISVAHVRANNFTHTLSRAALSLGYEETAIPLRFTSEDLNTLQMLQLPAEVTEVLR